MTYYYVDLNDEWQRVNKDEYDNWNGLKFYTNDNQIIDVIDFYPTIDYIELEKIIDIVVENKDY